jgi:hypothetical protein
MQHSCGIWISTPCLVFGNPIKVFDKPRKQHRWAECQVSWSYSYNIYIKQLATHLSWKVMLDSITEILKWAIAGSHPAAEMLAAEIEDAKGYSVQKGHKRESVTFCSLASYQWALRAACSGGWHPWSCPASGIHFCRRFNQVINQLDPIALPHYAWHLRLVQRSQSRTPRASYMCKEEEEEVFSPHMLMISSSNLCVTHETAASKLRSKERSSRGQHKQIRNKPDRRKRNS